MWLWLWLVGFCSSIATSIASLLLPTKFARRAAPFIFVFSILQFFFNALVYPPFVGYRKKGRQNSTVDVPLFGRCASDLL